MVSTVELVCVPVIRLKSWDIIRYWIWLWAVQGTLFTVSLRSQTQPWSVLVMRSWSSKKCFFLFGLTLLRNGTGGLFSSPCLTLDPHCPPYTCPLLLSQLWKPLDQVFQRAALTQPPHKATGACGKMCLPMFRNRAVCFQILCTVSSRVCEVCLKGVVVVDVLIC